MMTCLIKGVYGSRLHEFMTVFETCFTQQNHIISAIRIQLLLKIKHVIMDTIVPDIKHRSILIRHIPITIVFLIRIGPHIVIVVLGVEEMWKIALSASDQVKGSGGVSQTHRYEGKTIYKPLFEALLIHICDPTPSHYHMWGDPNPSELLQKQYIIKPSGIVGHPCMSDRKSTR